MSSYEPLLPQAVFGKFQKFCNKNLLKPPLFWVQRRRASGFARQCIITPLKKGKTIQFLSGDVILYYIDHASNNNNRIIQLPPHIPSIITGTPPAGYWCGTGCRVGGERTAAARGRESRGKSHAPHEEIKQLKENSFVKRANRKAIL